MWKAVPSLLMINSLGGMIFFVIGVFVYVVCVSDMFFLNNI